MKLTIEHGIRPIKIAVCPKITAEYPTRPEDTLSINEVIFVPELWRHTPRVFWDTKTLPSDWPDGTLYYRWRCQKCGVVAEDWMEDIKQHAQKHYV
jgi:hypothetical protein